MLKILNFVNCEPRNHFSKIYPSETSLGFVFILYLGISFFREDSRYSDVRLKNDKWHKIWIRKIEGILMILIK
jgi:hypothetical protein